MVTLVALLGLVEELEVCLEDGNCDVRARLRDIKERITQRLAALGRAAVEGV
jgi:hypothetical protein